MSCADDFEMVDERLRRVLTQYRESPKLLHWLRTYLRQVEIAAQSVCDLPSYFDLDTAVGDQLTLLGKRLGFPREHCVCIVQPVFGFDCGVTNELAGLNVLGFCVGVTWIDCADMGVSHVRIDDDDLYRKFLKVRRLQVNALFDLKHLNEAIREFWGQQAMVLDRRNGRVIIAPGRELTAAEKAVVQLYPRVMPVALGINVRFHFGDLYAFGFGEGWGGFCEGVAVEGEPILTVNDEPILAENGDPILAAAFGSGADWLCAIDVRPYNC